MKLEANRRFRVCFSAFTLVEVVISVAILALCLAGIVYGYVLQARRAEWSAYSLAAQSLASQAIEQARSAQWDPQAWPVIDELPPTNYSTVEPLDVLRSGAPVGATNFVTVTDVSTNPPLRQIRVACTWMFLDRGPFTNFMIGLRAPDQ
ncbi:MAG TPA: prepilin-type N-terminal cleavage/methylation domain-containing protein [Verrucomicrobiae bacterium]|nr:prepilin-type N-terminal cleavage/methylation domain-containing protein [Verrucomicrobiae bacterium]